MPRDERLTTEQILTATGTTREQLYLWIAQKLLPRPMIVSTARRSPVALWLRDTPTRVRFILARQRSGQVPTDIARALRQRWPAYLPGS